MAKRKSRAKPKRRKRTPTRRSAQSYARARQDGQQTRSAAAKARFIAAFAETGIVLRACLAANVGRRTYYEWTKTDPAFVAAREDAMQDALDGAEYELRRRGMEGDLRPVFQGGVKVGTVREKSDSNLQFWVKGRRPEIFNRERHEHSGPDGVPIPFEVIDRARESLTAKLEKIARSLQGIGGGPA